MASTLVIWIMGSWLLISVAGDSESDGGGSGGGGDSGGSDGLYKADCEYHGSDDN